MEPITPQAIERIGRAITERVASNPRKARFWFVGGFSVDVLVARGDTAEMVARRAVARLKADFCCDYWTPPVITGRYLPEAA